ncbi:MAG TPA: RtcB family protein [Cytophagales bacterium]|jgi:tRNA-splicing ligase RtcB (3'-phosphate/5'-hydroxy nucleic acid ligase)|nr:RtcB family protein [Cytophagales bacterium]
MKWEKDAKKLNTRVSIMSWCDDIDVDTLSQAINAANLPCVFRHVALMGDSHLGYGVPIGSVVSLVDCVCVNAVGVDIGCGMGFIKTDIKAGDISRELLDKIREDIHRRIPVGEGHAHVKEKGVPWSGFDNYISKILDPPAWMEATFANGEVSSAVWNLARLNLGTLGGGNHFIELQENEEGFLCIMLHSGSRNLGHRIASYYHKVAMELNAKYHSNIPTADLAFLPVDSAEGAAYLRDMNFALEYAAENRRRMMEEVKYAVMDRLGGFAVQGEVNIHHNYATLEKHFGHNVWVHRKGATSAKYGEVGIIPGSMGSASYIVRGLGNIFSFMSCSHGAGRKLGRNAASLELTKEECDKAMEGISFAGWKKPKRKGKKAADVEFDFGEAPGAYKSIDEVMKNQSDLVDVVHKMRPLAVVKG